MSDLKCKVLVMTHNAHHHCLKDALILIHIDVRLCTFTNHCSDKPHKRSKSSLWKSWHWLQKVIGIPWWKSIPLKICILYTYMNKIFILIPSLWWNHSYLRRNLVNMGGWRDWKPISVLIGTGIGLMSPQLQSGKLIKYCVAIIQCWKHVTILRI